MPEHQSDLKQLVERARQGDQDAARELVANWGASLRYVIHRKLSLKVRALLDCQDIEQSVWRSFFARLIHNPCPETPEGLCS
jgi:hypothetical protein